MNFFFKLENCKFLIEKISLKIIYTIHYEKWGVSAKSFNLRLRSLFSRFLDKIFRASWRLTRSILIYIYYMRKKKWSKNQNVDSLTPKLKNRMVITCNKSNNFQNYNIFFSFFFLEETIKMLQWIWKWKVFSFSYGINMRELLKANTYWAYAQVSS